MDLYLLYENERKYINSGGAKGGFETAKYFANRLPEHRVIIADKLEPDYNAISRITNIEYFKFDLFDLESVKKLREQIREYGTLEHYINFIGGAVEGELRVEIGDYNPDDIKILFI